MYPDNDPYSDDHPFPFSCHNLDRASQQLTLLAGFAALWNLAEKEINS
jgi:hypothetical protein